MSRRERIGKAGCSMGIRRRTRVSSDENVAERGERFSVRVFLYVTEGDSRRIA